MPSSLSLRREVPAPHTQHLLGPFAAIAQNQMVVSRVTVVPKVDIHTKFKELTEFTIWESHQHRLPEACRGPL